MSAGHEVDDGQTPRPYKVAAVEINPELFDFDRNVERACAVIDEAARDGARLIVMPEAALSGYIYRDLEQFLPYLGGRRPDLAVPLGLPVDSPTFVTWRNSRGYDTSGWTEYLQ